MTFPIEHAPLRSLSEIEAELAIDRLYRVCKHHIIVDLRCFDCNRIDDNPAASFKDDDK